MFKNIKMSYVIYGMSVLFLIIAGAEYFAGDKIEAQFSLVYFLTTGIWAYAAKLSEDFDEHLTVANENFEEVDIFMEETISVVLAIQAKEEKETIN